MNYNIIATALENKLSREIIKNNFLLNKEKCLKYIKLNISNNDNVCVINNAMLLVTLLMNQHDIKKIIFIYDDIQKKLLAEMLGLNGEQLIVFQNINNSNLKELSNKNKILTCMFYHEKDYFLFDIPNVYNFHPINDINYYENKNNFSKIKHYTIIDICNNKIIKNVAAGSILKEVVNILDEDKKEVFLNKIINNKSFKINNLIMCLDETLKLKLILESTSFIRKATWGHKFKLEDRNIFYCTQFGYSYTGKLCILIKEYLLNILGINSIFIEPQKNKL